MAQRVVHPQQRLVGPEIIERWPDIMVYENDGFIDGTSFTKPKLIPKAETRSKSKSFSAPKPGAYQGLLAYLSTQKEVDVIEYLAPRR